MDGETQAQLDELTMYHLRLDAQHAALLMTVSEIWGRNDEQVEAFDATYARNCETQFLWLTAKCDKSGLIPPRRCPDY